MLNRVVQPEIIESLSLCVDINKEKNNDYS